MNKLIVEKSVKTSMTANPSARRILILVGLLIASFMSTSYARNAGSGANCAANYRELENHPEARGMCSKEILKKRLNDLSGRVWNGPLGYTVEFRNVRENENFYLIFNNARMFGNICCSDGIWKIGGYQVGAPRGNSLMIGDYKFTGEQQSTLRTPVQFAELQGPSQDGVN